MTVNKKETFFANKLLERLKTESPLLVAYESQVRSADVGFDFASPQMAFDRLKDELRELGGALSAFENGTGNREHLCDEAADTIFGVINVLRHMNVAMEAIFPRVDLGEINSSEKDAYGGDEIIQKTFTRFEATFHKCNSLNESSGDLIEVGVLLMQKSVDFISAHGMSPKEVVRENVTKYLRRCQFIENELKKENKEWNDLTLEEIYAHWKKAKQVGF